MVANEARVHHAHSDQEAVKHIALFAIALVSLSCRDARPPTGPIGPVVTRGDDAFPGEMESYIVTLKRDAAPASEFAKARGISPKFVYLRALNGFAAALGASAAAQLAREPQVASVSKDQVMHLTTDQVNAGWNLDRIDQRTLPLNGVYRYASTGAGATAYILDTGIRYGHADFGGRARFGWDVDGKDGSDCYGHGTHVAGIVGGATYGVAKGVALVSVKVFPLCTGSTPTSNIVAGLDYVAANAPPGSVANMSIGGPFDPVLNQAVENTGSMALTQGPPAGAGLAFFFVPRCFDWRQVWDSLNGRRAALKRRSVMPSQAATAGVNYMQRSKP